MQVEGYKDIPTNQRPAKADAVEPESEGEIDMEGKEAYEDDLHSQLDEWTAIVGRLRAKVENDYGDVQMILMEEVEGLAAYTRRAQTYLQELHESHGDAWKAMKPGIELVRDEMRQALDRAWKRIEIKPAVNGDRIAGQWREAKSGQ